MCVFKKHGLEVGGAGQSWTMSNLGFDGDVCLTDQHHHK